MSALLKIFISFFFFFLRNVEPFHGHNWALPSVKGCSTLEVWNNLSGSVVLSIPPPSFFSFSGLKCDQIAAWLWMEKIILTQHSSQCFGENAHIQTHLLMSDSRCEKKERKIYEVFSLKLETHFKTLLRFVLFRLIMTSALCCHNRH